MELGGLQSCLRKRIRWRLKVEARSGWRLFARGAGVNLKRAVSYRSRVIDPGGPPGLRKAQ
jgi:hypothetical protein